MDKNFIAKFKKLTMGIHSSASSTTMANLLSLISESMVSILLRWPAGKLEISGRRLGTSYRL